MPDQLTRRWHSDDATSSGTADSRRPAATRGLMGLAVVAVLAIGLQVQATSVILGTPLRLTLSDLLSPLIVLALLWSVYRGAPARWPRWRIARMELWLAGLTLVMSLSLVVGRIEIGAWFGWALVSKYVGWFVLLWYFLLAAWIVRNYGIKARAFFASMFVYVCLAIATIDLIARGFRLINIDAPAPLKLGWARLQGFMENPNAYAFLVSIAVLLTLCRLNAGRVVTPWLAHAALAVFFAVLFLTASRGAWLALGLVGCVILLTRQITLLRPLLLAAPAAIALVLAVQVIPSTVIALQQQDRPTVNSPNDLTGELTALKQERLRGTDSDTAYRLESGREAIEIWWRHPILGQGLGTYLWSHGGEVRADGMLPTIHNSFLWIMAEMGTLGALAFGGFFLLALIALRPAYIGRDADTSGFQYASFLMLILFAGMSLTSEMLYQRHFWFLLGLALAVPAEGIEHARAQFGSLGAAGTKPQSG